MNVTRTIAIAAALIAASASIAQASEYQDFSNVISSRSRAEVVAEVAAARVNGDTLEVRDTTYPEPSQSSVAGKSRQEVLAELTAARANGDTLKLRDTTYPAIAQASEMRRSRQEVLAELAQFRAEHPNFISDLDYPSAFQSPPMQQRMVSTRATAMAQ